MERKTRKLSMAVLLPAIAVTIAAAVVLVLAHQHTVRLERRAAELNYAVTLSRSVMDMYTKSADAAAFAEALEVAGYTPQSGAERVVLAVPFKEKNLEAEISAVRESALETVTVRVCAGDEEIYTLQTQRHVQDGEGGGLQ